MKVYDTKDIRNIALLGHGSAGKTTLSEAIVHTAGITSRMGRIEDNNTKSDYLEDEISRHISISTSLIQLEWQECKFNIVDTPGYADFIGEVICSIESVDAAVILIDAVSGLEVGTETAWELCEKHEKPRFIVVNRTGKEHANYEGVLKSIHERFGIHVLPLQISVNPGIGFNKIIDIVTMKEYTYKLNGNGIGSASDISNDFSASAEKLHEKLIEAAAESDDSLMEKYFESGLAPEEINSGIKQAFLNRTLFPVIFTDAYTNVGADLLMKLVLEKILSPEEMPSITGKKSGSDITLQPKNDSPLTMRVFKTIAEQHMGELSLFRMYSGSYKVGDELYNVNHSASERPTLIYNLIGKDKMELPSINTGDIGVFVKLKSTKTGNTLCTKHMQIELPSLEFPEPVMDVAVYPKTKGDEDKVSQGLVKLHDEDPSFRVRTDPELKQIILEGLGGLHIDVIVERFKRKFGLDVVLKEPKIPYRETITGKSESKYRYKKQSGGRGQYGEVYFRMEPKPRGESFEFVNKIKGGVIPSRFIPAVEKGILEAMKIGPLSKSKVIDIKVELYYGSFHTVDSSEQAFKMASLMCFRDCFLQAKPILLEPIYTIEVKVPDAYTGDVMGDLSSRRGKILGMEPAGIFQVVKAHIPLAELYMYATHLRSLTQGRGAYSRSFSNYEMVPPDIVQKIIEAAKEEEK